MSEVLSFPDHFKEMDEAKPPKLHWRIMFISGMGFLTDHRRSHDHPEVAVACGALGALTTFFLLPEPKGKSLEEMELKPETPMERAAA